MQRILIVKLGAIGDVVMTLPAAHALYLSGATIDWVCGPTVAPLLRCYPWINVIVADEKAILKGSLLDRAKALFNLWGTIGRTEYSLCATLYYDSRYKLLALPVRARRKLLLSHTDRALTLLPGRHHTDEYARILLAFPDEQRPVALRPVSPQSLPTSPLPRVADAPRVVIAPGGAKNMLRDDALRRWPVESYAEVAVQLIRSGAEVVLIGGPDDAWVTPHFKALSAINLIGRLTLPETLALLDDSDVAVTHDSGPLHLAGITRAGIVAIFGPTDPQGRLPQRENCVAIWGGEGFACRPCYDGRDYAPCKENGCMRQVTPTMVLQQIEVVMQQRRTSLLPLRSVNPSSTISAK